jgi:IstB-like ATP binding protein
MFLIRRRRRCVYFHEGVKHPERVLFSTLERVAADNRPEPASGIDRADLVEQLVVVEDRGAAGEDHNPPAGESAIDDMPDALSRSRDRNALFVVNVAGCLLLFSRRYERGSTVVTSNLPFDEWTSVFGSERLTGALLDRFTHHVPILEMNGDSYRLNQSKHFCSGQPTNFCSRVDTWSSPLNHLRRWRTEDRPIKIKI